MKKFILALGIVTLIAGPAFANNLENTNTKFVDEPTQFVDQIDQFGSKEANSNLSVILGNSKKTYDNGIVKQDVRLPRIDNPVLKRNRVQAYNIVDHNSIYNNQNVINNSNSRHNVVIETNDVVVTKRTSYNHMRHNQRTN